MRERLSTQGLLLEHHGNGFLVTDGGVKTPFEKHFKNLEEVEIWFAGRMQHNNRLSDEGAEEFDREFDIFCRKENDL
jgi:hypothetical protein